MGQMNTLPGYTVLVVAKFWPSWCFSLQTCGCTLRALVLMGKSWLPVCKCLLPSSTVLLYSEFLLDQSCSLVADIFISDIDLPTTVHLWRRVKHIYISRQGIRHSYSIPSHFTSHFSSLTHTECGGVTTGHWKLRFCLINTRSWTHSNRPICTLRYLSSIVHSTVSHGLPCPPPPPLTHLHDFLIRPNTYHGHGLFPFWIRDAYFVVPSVYTPSKWCRRHLTGEETVLALDISDQHIQSLTSDERKAICNDTSFIPGKVVQSFLIQVFSLLDGPSHLNASVNPLCFYSYGASPGFY
jgi:hypothetical protein